MRLLMTLRVSLKDAWLRAGVRVALRPLLRRMPVIGALQVTAALGSGREAGPEGGARGHARFPVGPARLRACVSSLRHSIVVAARLVCFAQLLSRSAAEVVRPRPTPGLGPLSPPSPSSVFPMQVGLTRVPEFGYDLNLSLASAALVPLLKTWIDQAIRDLVMQVRSVCCLGWADCGAGWPAAKGSSVTGGAEPAA
jgi:hypothetical protein